MPSTIYGKNAGKAKVAKPSVKTTGPSLKSQGNKPTAVSIAALIKKYKLSPTDVTRLCLSRGVARENLTEANMKEASIEKWNTGCVAGPYPEKTIPLEPEVESSAKD